MSSSQSRKNFRKRSASDSGHPDGHGGDDDDGHRHLTLEEVKFLQKQRERRSGISAAASSSSTSSLASPSSASAARRRSGDGAAGADAAATGEAAEKEDLVLQDTFAQETAVTIEDPNMIKYVEQELAKRRGKKVDASDKEEKDPLNELYIVPDHLKVRKRNSEESSTQWTTGIAEVQLPIEYKLRNIEETEAAKKLLQERRLSGKTKPDSSIPSSYSADYYRRGKDYAEKLRREHPELYKDGDFPPENAGGKQPAEGNNLEGATRRETATDEFLLERFRKREKFRVLRR